MKSIALGGFMGTGKSTVGPRLAQKLGMPFHDLDLLIEQHAQMTIPQIFQGRGEPAFRAIESAILADVAARPPQVLALGGGTLHQPPNLPILTEHFHVIVLDARWETLLGRLSERAAQGRPLWPQAKALYRRRRPGYLRAGASAGTVVSVDERSPQQVVDAILQVLPA
ncbi:MAG: shikimate kinase [Myxococcota bacterium]